jgi:hypothetical protein
MNKHTRAGHGLLSPPARPNPPLHSRSFLLHSRSFLLHSRAFLLHSRARAHLAPQQTTQQTPPLLHRFPDPVLPSEIRVLLHANRSPDASALPTPQSGIVSSQHSGAPARIVDPLIATRTSLRSLSTIAVIRGRCHRRPATGNVIRGRTP